MKHVIETFCTLFLLMLNLFLCAGAMTVGSQVAVAKEYKADMIAEIENSNFNEKVMEACVREADRKGYVLHINKAVDLEGRVHAAEVWLDYTYQFPLLGISETKTTYGIAR